MDWFLIIILVVGGFAFLGSGSTRSKSSNSKKSAHDIADEITTFAHFRALEKKVERAELKVRKASSSYDENSNQAEDRASDRLELLQEALHLVSQKILRWQFIPEVDLDTPLKAAMNAYKVFSEPIYEEKLREFGGDEDEWCGMDGYDEPEEKDDDIKFIVKFRKIVENSELSEAEKDKKVNSLVSRNREPASNFFELDSAEKPSEQWRKEST